MGGDGDGNRQIAILLDGNDEKKRANQRGDQKFVKTDVFEKLHMIPNFLLIILNNFNPINLYYFGTRSNPNFNFNAGILKFYAFLCQLADCPRSLYFYKNIPLKTDWDGAILYLQGMRRSHG